MSVSQQARNKELHARIAELEAECDSVRRSYRNLLESKYLVEKNLREVQGDNERLDAKVSCLRSRIVGLWSALKEARPTPRSELIYLAVPYSHPDPDVREARAGTVNLCAAHLVQKGHHVFSPISQGHAVATAGLDLPTSWEHWAAYSRRMLGCCTELCVLCLDGWSTSVGVQAEIAEAERLGLRIAYRDAP